MAKLIEPLKWSWEALLPLMLQAWLDRPQDRNDLEKEFRAMARMADAEKARIETKETE
jgi:hypothetical protein